MNDEFIHMTDRELQLKAVRLRKLTLEAIVGAGAGKNQRVIC